ncbi:MAG: ABC transporter ATP-binding protein [Thermodesulfobacteriota bacterium]
MKKPVITFENVTKHYHLYHHLTGGIKNFLFNLPKNIKSMNSNYEALKDISFEVYAGETFGIIGRNGAGKSTALGLMAGVMKPSSGTVTVKGRVSPLLSLGGGFHPDLTGRENIVLNGVLMGLTKAEVLRKMEEIIDFSELGRFIEQPIRTYSSGMYARLGFSVVAHLDPEILLIDEVLAVGDMDFQEKCLKKMLGFKERGVTMVLVTHSMGNVTGICDRAMWIEDHRVRMMGGPEEVTGGYTNYKRMKGPLRRKIIDYQKVRKTKNG